MAEMDDKMLQQAQEPTEQSAIGTESMAPEEETPRGRAALRGRYRERHPETNWDEADDDALADQAIADYDETNAQLNRYKEQDKKFDDLFQSHPESAAFLYSMTQDDGNDDVVERVYKHFGDDIIAAMDDPNRRAKLKELRKQKAEEAKQAALQKEQWERNMQGSLERLQAYKEQNGIDDAQLEAGLDEMYNVVKQFEDGEITEDTFDRFIKGAKYDADITKAKADGERNGRNAKIDEQMRKSVAESGGLPSLGGASGNAQGKPMRRDRNGMGNVGSDIWNSADMKRTKYE